MTTKETKVHLGKTVEAELQGEIIRLSAFDGIAEHEIYLDVDALLRLIEWFDELMHAPKKLHTFTGLPGGDG